MSSSVAHVGLEKVEFLKLPDKLEIFEYICSMAEIRRGHAKCLH